MAVCIASGPSVTQEMIEMVRAARERDAVRVVVVNDMYLVAPWADLLYFADAAWWKRHVEGSDRGWPWVRFSAEQVRKAFAEFPGQKVTIQHPTIAADPSIVTLKNDGPEGLSEKPDAIRTGANSGYQSLNIATLSGANPILLLGYDMRYQGARSHSHNGHERKMNESVYRGFAKNFSTVERPIEKLGIRVVNCSPESAIECFPKMALAEALECRAPSA